MQTRIESLIEQCLNVGSGFIIALLFMQFAITPLFGLDTQLHQNAGITVLFTVVSIVRGYCWRRFFARGVHRVVVAWVRGKQC